MPTRSRLLRQRAVAYINTRIRATSESMAAARAKAKYRQLRRDLSRGINLGVCDDVTS